MLTSLQQKFRVYGVDLRRNHKGMLKWISHVTSGPILFWSNLDPPNSGLKISYARTAPRNASPEFGTNDPPDRNNGKYRTNYGLVVRLSVTYFNFKRRV